MGPANPCPRCARGTRERVGPAYSCPWSARWTRERVGPANPCPWCARATRESVGPANTGSMVCQRDQREGGTSKPWVHGVPEGPERGWDQQTLGPWCAKGIRERVGPEYSCPWSARGTKERVGPANPGFMVCQRDQREGGASIFMSMVCQSDHTECGTSKPWVHDVPEGPERGWDQQTLGPWCARGTRERVGPANPRSMVCQKDQREGGTRIFMSMECQRDQREGGTSKPWVHGVPEGPEKGWGQQTLGPWCAKRIRERVGPEYSCPWSARGTKERVGPANPGSMVCQRDQREGGASKPMSKVCQRDQGEGGTSKPWVHGVPEGPVRGWDQQTLGPWCARGTRERVGPANPGSMVCQMDQREGGTRKPMSMEYQRDQREGGTSKPWVHDVPEGPERGWDQKTHVHGVPEGPERGWDQQTLGPRCARGTRERVGPANPGSMVCQRDQREGGTRVHDV